MIDTRLVDGYNIGRLGGAGLTSLESLNAYPPGRSSFFTARPSRKCRSANIRYCSQSWAVTSCSLVRMW